MEVIIIITILIMMIIFSEAPTTVLTISARWNRSVVTQASCVPCAHTHISFVTSLRSHVRHGLILSQEGFVSPDTCATPHTTASKRLVKVQPCCNVICDDIRAQSQKDRKTWCSKSLPHWLSHHPEELLPNHVGGPD